MSDLNHEELLEVRRKMAKANNKDRWSISGTGQTNKEYAKGADKNGLSKSDRARIEAVKDRQTYGNDDVDLW